MDENGYGERNTPRHINEFIDTYPAYFNNDLLSTFGYFVKTARRNYKLRFYNDSFLVPEIDFAVLRRRSPASIPEYSSKLLAQTERGINYTKLDSLVDVRYADVWVSHDLKNWKQIVRKVPWLMGRAHLGES